MATIKAARSPLYWKKAPGGLPAIVDVTKFSGNVYYVDSNAAGKGDTAGYGQEPDKPFATIDFAIGQCTANQGDVILVLPGHAETATAITCDVAGVTIVGLGEGTVRPSLTGDAVADVITATADNVRIENIRFVTPSAAVTALINVAAANARVKRCRFELGANVVDAVTITADGELPIFEDNEVIVAADGPDSWLKFEGVVDRPVVRNNLVIGSDGTNAFDDGVFDFNNVAVTNPMIYDNVFDGADVATTVVANGGSVVGASYGPNVYAGSATSADNVASQSEILDQLSGASGIPTFPAAAIPANAVSLAEVIRQIYAALEGTAASQNGVATWPASAAPANNVSIAEVLGWINDALQGANGVVTFPNAAVPANGVSLAEVIRDIWAALQGTAVGENGVQTWPAAAAPGNNVSLAEAIRYIVETLIGTLVNTGGTATLGGILGDFANISLVTRLNTNGVAIANGAITAAKFGAGAIDAAAIATNAVDADAIADNAIDAAAIAADAITNAKLADNAFAAEQFALSAAERTTEGVVVTRATAALPQTTAAAIFTVTGLCLLKRIVGYVTVQIGAVANATKLQANSTGAGATTDLCTALDINGHAVDSRYEITGTFANAMVRTLDVPLAKVQVTDVVLPPGTIDLDCAGSDGGTGRIRWSVTYVPMEAGAQIVAA